MRKLPDTDVGLIAIGMSVARDKWRKDAEMIEKAAMPGYKRLVQQFLDQSSQADFLAALFAEYPEVTLDAGEDA